MPRTHQRVTGNAPMGAPTGREARLASWGAGEYSLRNQLASSFPARRTFIAANDRSRARGCVVRCLLLRTRRHWLLAVRPLPAKMARSLAAI